MQILKGTGINWCERRLISNLYAAQSVKVLLNRGETRSVKIGRGSRQECCLTPISFNLYSECPTRVTLEGFGGLKIGAQIINTVNYADDLVLLVIDQTQQGNVESFEYLGRMLTNDGKL
jgi:hypothetical protein